MNIIISVFFIFIIYGCSNPVEQDGDKTEKSFSHSITLKTIPAKHKAKVLKYFKEFVKNRNFNGQLLVAKGNTIIFDTTTGYANIKKRIPLKENSAIQLASITKPITATVLLQLVEEGKLSVYDTITKFLPNLPKHYSSITIEHLLAHRSGLAQYYYYCDALIENRQELIYNDTVLCVINFHNPDHYFKPGKQHNYCNTNYLLLASIIEAIERKSYPNIVKKRIFDPCKMDDSFVIDINKNTFPSNLTLGHSLNNKVFKLDYLDGVVGDKGIFSSARDLFKFDRFLSNCGLLNDSLLQIAISPHNKIKRNASYGYGWRLRYHDVLGKIVYHNGWWHGNRHTYFKIPNSDYTVIILSNALRGSAYSLNEMLDVFDLKKQSI